MAKIKLLIDTDIFIDALKGVKSAMNLFRSREIELYCSILVKKELLAKEGLKSSERREIFSLLSKTKIFKIDDDITQKFSFLVKQYGEKKELFSDYIIAATAWAKNLPLLTRNKKHFERIKEIKLSPVYEEK